MGLTSRTTSSVPERSCSLEEDKDEVGDGAGDASLAEIAFGEFKQVGGALVDTVLTANLSATLVSSSSSSNDIMCVCTFFRVFRLDVEGSIYKQWFDHEIR